ARGPSCALRWSGASSRRCAGAEWPGGQARGFVPYGSPFPGLLVRRPSEGARMFFSVAEVALDPLLLLTALRHVGEVALTRGLRLVMPCAQGLEARVVVSLGLD